MWRRIRGKRAATREDFAHQEELKRSVDLLLPEGDPVTKRACDMYAIPETVYEAIRKSFRADWVERQKSSHALHDFLADVNCEREVRKVAQPL